MAITIKDVAQLANVVPSTVSRVIANDPRISEITKVRVRKAMEKLGYHPNLIARSLANQSTRLIGLVLPCSSNSLYQNPFFPTILQGLNEGVQEKHYSLLLSTGKTKDGREVLTIKKEFSFLKARYTIDAAGIEVHGNWWDMDFQVLQHGQIVGKVCKEWFTWGDSYKVQIIDEEMETIITALVVAIDCVKADQAAASSAASI
ncbi:LURP-one-related family protein [Peribacillus frigoritolerans]|uniref:LURP-one-related family protein n=1 Tax=Peribacillus frigoritolerans TaxID=450367 RepID=UPI002E201692|nr:LURP-one-related family protein [Peribacillus frigoritolerans]